MPELWHAATNSKRLAGFHSGYHVLEMETFFNFFFLQVCGIQTFRSSSLRGLNMFPTMSVSICPTLSRSRKWWNFTYRVLLCLESGFENQVGHVEWCLKLVFLLGLYFWCLFGLSFYVNVVCTFLGLCVCIRDVFSTNHCLFWKYKRILFWNENTACLFCKSWCYAAKIFLVVHTASDREIPACWEDEKCYMWLHLQFVIAFCLVDLYLACACLFGSNRFRKWELTAFVQRFHLCVQHHVGGSEIVPISSYRFVFSLSFVLCLMRWLQAYCNKSGNAVLVKDRGVGCCQSGLLKELESLQPLKLFACRMTSAGLQTQCNAMQQTLMEFMVEKQNAFSKILHPFTQFPG